MIDFMNREPRLDFTKIKIFFNVARDQATEGTEYFRIDNVRCTKGTI